MRWEAKIVLIKVDFPSPVCPEKPSTKSSIFFSKSVVYTNADDIELEAAFEEFPLNLFGDAVKTDVALRHDRRGGLRRVSSSHGGIESQK